MSSDFSDWYKSVPQITRGWFTGSVVLPLIARFGLISPMYLVLLFQPFWNKFHFWRPITGSFLKCSLFSKEYIKFYYPITPQTGFTYLINLYFMYSYSTRLETGTFDGRPADFLFMLIFNWLLLVMIGFAAGIFYLMDPMILAVMYVWCQLNRDTIVMFCLKLFLFIF